MSGPKTLGDLAAAEQVRAPTMSRLVSEMERNRVARKVADRRDARVLHVHATAKGLRALQRGRTMRIAGIEQLLVGRSASELASLERAVGLMEEMLGAGPAPHVPSS